jgi:uncharacterized protein (TIGR02118 family)
MWVSVSFYKRKPGTSWEEFSQHWREVHGPLLGKSPILSKYLKRYVQHHIRPNDCFPGVEPLPFDGFSEAWFDSVDDRRKMWSEAEYQSVVVPDEHKFLDMTATRVSMIDTQVVQFGGDIAAAFASGASTVVIR